MNTEFLITLTKLIPENKRYLFVCIVMIVLAIYFCIRKKNSDNIKNSNIKNSRVAIIDKEKEKNDYCKKNSDNIKNSNIENSDIKIGDK